MQFSTKNTKTVFMLTISAFILSSFSISAKAAEEPIKLEGYIDSYIAMDNDSNVMFDTSKDKKRATNNRGLNALGFRKNEFNLNMAQLSVSKNADWYRGRFTLSYGTTPLQSWPMEYLPIQEAYAGIKAYNNLWVDAGIFLTHIGVESLLPKNNHLSLLSLTTMYKPFYQSGVKVSYKPVDQFEAQLHVLNGLGIIEDNNNDKSLGWLLSYSPNASFNITDSGSIGNEEKAGDPAAFLAYNNLNLSYQPIDPLNLRASMDIAMKSNAMSNLYYSGLVSGKYAINKNFALSLRGEMTNDDKKVLTVGTNGLGVTAGLEFKPTDNSYLRLEGRQLMLANNKENQVFKDAAGAASSSRLEGMLSMGVSF